MLSRTLVAGNTSWVAGAAPEPGTAGAAKTRYRQADARCVFASAGASGDARFELRFDDEQWAVTPGQSAVLYPGDVCLGGGIIESAATVQDLRQASQAALLAAR